MSKIKQIDKDTRIVLKMLPKARDYCFCLQRRKYKIWFTVSFVYPSLVAEKDIPAIYEWLLWCENKDKNNTSVNQKKIGINIFKNYENIKSKP